jgi:hypothetical protein
VIGREEMRARLLQSFPDFAPRWNAFLEEWGGQPPTACSDMREFQDYVLDFIDGKADEQLRRVFELVEQLMVEGDDEVRTATATCFLEDLQNIAAAGRISADFFVPLLGPESRAYCKAWDEFTGAQTPGLW